MRWVLVDVLVALLCVALLAGVARRLWRRVTALGAAVSAAGARLEQVSAQVSSLGGRDAPFATSSPGGHAGPAPGSGRGVGSTPSPRRNP